MTHERTNSPSRTNAEPPPLSELDHLHRQLAALAEDLGLRLPSLSQATEAAQHAAVAEALITDPGPDPLCSILAAVEHLCSAINSLTGQP